MADSKKPKPDDDRESEERIKILKKKIEDPAYLDVAVDRLAQELTIEIMENTYGVSFH